MNRYGNYYCIITCIEASFVGFIENDEAIVECAAAHEGDGRDFDDITFEKLFDAVAVQHVEQSVVERAQVRVDLFLQGAGEAMAGSVE